VLQSLQNAELQPQMQCSEVPADVAMHAYCAMGFPNVQHLSQLLAVCAPSAADPQIK
jgi:hypothetical protein